MSFYDNMKDFILPVAPQSEKREEVQQLYKAIRRLMETDRAIITLHLEDYDNPEIAEMMGISSNYLGVKLYRIKNQLQVLLKSA